MTDVTRALRSRFVSAQARCARAAGLINDPELAWHYADTARRLERLCTSIDRIPSATVRLTEQIAAMAGRARFDAALDRCIADVGRRSFPESAAELLGVVNLSLRSAEFHLAGE